MSHTSFLTKKMYALTLWRPWDQAIIHGPKRVENRTWPPPANLIGETIALHAGARWDKEGLAFMEDLGFRPALTENAAPKMCIVGVATIASVTRATNDLFTSSDDPWAFGPVCWHLKHIRALKEPVPMKGKQGLWALTPDDTERVLSIVCLPR